MARYSPQEQDNMRREASRRAREMQLSHLDSDHMLILAMMAMIYKDGGNESCDKKLLMALAYLLT